MKKIFEAPEVNVVPFNVEDIITASSELPEDNRDGELPDV